MFVCSLSTLLFNGNPLLRYDGYYVLADLLEVPNLGQQSRWLLGRMLAGFFLGSDSPPDRAVPRNRRAVLLAYGVASVLYGWLVLIGILWFCYRVLEPRGLQGALHKCLTWIVIAGAVVIPAGKLAATMLDPPRRPRPAALAGPVYSVSAYSVVLLAGALLTPLPYAVHAPAVVEPRDAQQVYVVVPGRIESSVSPGDSVVAGQELARLVNLDLRKETAELAGLLGQQRLAVGRSPPAAGQRSGGRRSDPGGRGLARRYRGAAPAAAEG